MLKIPNVNTTASVTLNIGLNGSIAFGKYKHENAEQSPVLTIADVLNAPYKAACIIDKLGFLNVGDDLQYRVAQSNSEATLVVKLQADTRNIIAQVFELSELLQQDCIAVWIHNDNNGGKGQLIGRYHYVWGEFNPEYFIHLENNNA